MCGPSSGEGGDINILTATTDSDWASDVVSRKSTSCGVLSIEGAIQGVYSRGQEVLAMSSGEAEFYGAGSVVNEAIGLAGIYNEMGFPMSIVLQLDSTAAIGMIQKRGAGRARHIDLRHLHLQSKLRDGTVSAMEKVDTSVNVADIGTKYFHADRLEELMDQLGLQVCGDVVMPVLKRSEFSKEGIQASGRGPQHMNECFRVLECCMATLKQIQADSWRR